MLLLAQTCQPFFTFWAIERRIGSAPAISAFLSPFFARFSGSVRSVSSASSRPVILTVSAIATQPLRNGAESSHHGSNTACCFAQRCDDQSAIAQRVAL